MAFYPLCYLLFLASILFFILITMTKKADSDLIFLMGFNTFFCVIFAICFLKKKYKEVNRTNFIMLTMFNISLTCIVYSVFSLLFIRWILGIDNTGMK